MCYLHRRAISLTGGGLEMNDQYTSRLIHLFHCHKGGKKTVMIVIEFRTLVNLSSMQINADL